MSIRLIKFLSIMLGICLVILPVYAQPIPPLTDLASDSTGNLHLFYPPNWIRETENETTLVLSESGLAAGTEQIILRVNMQDVGMPIEVGEWLIEQGIVPANAAISQEVYGGYESWLAQGEFQRGTFSAVVAIPLPNGQIGIINSQFPMESLAEDAALVTSILDAMVILPDRVEMPQLEMNIPDRWFYADSQGVIFAAAAETDYQRLVVGEIPDGLAIRVRLINADTSIEELLSSPTAVEIDRQEFMANGALSVMQVRRDYTVGSTELMLIGQRSEELFIELRAVSSDPAIIAEQTDLLQAIFAGIGLR